MASDPLFTPGAAEKVLAFRSAAEARARQGWVVNIVVSAGNTARLEAFEQLVTSLEGPNVEVRAYPYRLPLVMTPLIIANREVLIGYDHRRWERPAAALVLRSRVVVDWATSYFEGLMSDAPFRLRSPTGIDYIEFDRFRAALAEADAVPA